MKLLHIIASPNGEYSKTLSISKPFLEQLKISQPDLEIEELSLFEKSLPEIGPASVQAKFANIGFAEKTEATEKAWKEMEQIAEHFLSFDTYLITCPMWNFSIPYKLKHYIDVIIQPGIMFNFTETGIAPLIEGKKMFCLTSRGSDYQQGSPIQQFDFQEPYLRAIFGMIGIVDVDFVNAQPVDIAPEITKQSIGNAIEDASKLVASLPN